MSDARTQVVFVALAVAESVTAYAILGMLGLMLGLGGSPLPWHFALMVYAGGLGAAWITGGIRGAPATLALVFGAVGLGVVYLAVSSATISVAGRYELNWLVRMLARDLTADEAVSIVIAAIACVLIWRRTSTLVRDASDAAERLKSAFKRGLVILAIALIADEVASEPFGIATLLLPFFIATLTGLAIARLADDSPLTGAWVRVILVALAGFVGVGLIAGLAGSRYGSTGLSALYTAYGWLVDAVIWVLRWPLTLVGWLIALLIDFLRSLINAEPPEPQEQPAGQQGTQFPDPEPAANPAESQWIEAILDALQWPLTILLPIVLLVVLALAYRRIIARRRRGDDIERESIRGEVEDVSYWDLLRGLLPAWLTARGRRRHLWRYPDTPGIAGVFMLYFEMLQHSIERGMEFNARLTPMERQPLLESVLPGAPVSDITDRFNAACYGDLPTPDARVEQLRQQLETAVENAPPPAEPEDD